MYENDEEDEILLGWGLLTDAIISFRNGVKVLLEDCPTESGQEHLLRIKALAGELDSIEKRYSSTLYHYESQQGSLK